MKPLAAFLLLTAVLVAPTFAVETITKKALLWVPRTDMHSRIVEFRWDEEEPLRIDVWPRGADFSTRGIMRVYTDDDQLVPVSSVTISDPPISGSQIVKRGELVRLYFDFSELHVILRSGDYYEVAFFEGSSGERPVRFVTKPHWFAYRKG